MDDEASPDPSTASADADAPDPVPGGRADDSSPADGPPDRQAVDRRLRQLAGRKAPYRGPIVARTRGWVSRDSRWHVLAARFLDFAVLTEEHLVVCSTGFFSRRPRRQVLREPFTRLVVTPIGEEPIRTLRIVGDFSRPIRMELRGDEETAVFVQELLARTPPDPRRRVEPWASMGQLGLDPGFTEPEPAVDADPTDEHTAQP